MKGVCTLVCAERETELSEARYATEVRKELLSPEPGIARFVPSARFVHVGDQNASVAEWGRSTVEIDAFKETQRRSPHCLGRSLPKLGLKLWAREQLESSRF